MCTDACRHQAEVSAVCWLRNGEAAPSGQQCRPEQMAQGVYTVADAPGVYTAKGAYTDDEIQLFASGAYNGTIKIWDARQADPKSLSGHFLLLRLPLLLCLLLLLQLSPFFCCPYIRMNATRCLCSIKCSCLIWPAISCCCCVCCICRCWCCCCYIGA